MNLENVKKGLDRLFVGEIIDLVGTFIGILYLGIVHANKDQTVFILCVGIISSIAMIVGMILQVSGLIKAAKEDKMFALAIAVVVLCILFFIVEEILATFNAGIMTFELAQTLVIVTDGVSGFAICYGISNAFSEKEDYSMMKKGKRIGALYAILFIVSGFFRIYIDQDSVFPSVDNTVGAFFFGLSCIIEVIIFTVFLVYLYSAKNKILDEE